MNENNELDDLFKKRLDGPGNQAGYNEDDWDALEQMLDKRKKRRGVIYWLPVLGSAAALLLLFLGYWAFRPHVDGRRPQNNQQAANKPQAHSGTNGGSIRQQTDHSSKKLTPASIADNKKQGSGTQSFLPLSAYGSRRTTGLAEPETANEVARPQYESLTSEMVLPVFPGQKTINEQITTVNLNVLKKTAYGLNSAGAAKTATVIKTGYRPQFAISVLAAPDINGVGSFQQSKVGTNEGLLFYGGISKRFTISTGAIYSVKPYITGFENYHTGYQFPVNPVSVTADCRMLDIPLNIGYQVYNKYQNKVTIGTGLSSYIMLHESYTFNYADAYASGPSQYTVPGVNKYIFGVVNFNATFQHQVNSKIGYSIQPYLKLPLTNIGYSQVRLQTTGVALGLTWNLNSSLRP